MSRPNNVGDLTPSEWARLDALLDKFEEASHKPDSLDLGHFLPAADDRLRSLVLRELIKSELEIRWRRGQRVLIEDYLKRFPELEKNPALLPSLLYEEYIVRHRHGDRPELSTYQDRFPDRLAALQQLVRDNPPPTYREQTPVTPSPEPIPPPVPPPAVLALQNRGGVLPVGGGYKLLKRLGIGAFGEVWHAEAPGGVEVAIKIIHRPLDHAEAQRELEALGVSKNLRHAFVLQTQAFWALEDRLVIAMDLAEGSLRDRLKEFQTAEKPGIPLLELLRYTREAAEALDFLHNQSVLHRDVKPENILLLGGHVKLADLGLARRLGSHDLFAATTCGSPPYMAPEVWRGSVSPMSDQYSLAATYVELRRNRPLFSHNDLMQIMFDHAEREPDLAPLPEAEQQVVLKALAKDPEQRFANCLKFWRALQQAGATTPPTVARAKAVREVQRAARKRTPETDEAPPKAIPSPIAEKPSETALTKSFREKPRPVPVRRTASWMGVMLCVTAVLFLISTIALGIYLGQGGQTTEATEASVKETGPSPTVPKETPKETVATIPKETRPTHEVETPPSGYAAVPAAGDTPIKGKNYYNRIEYQIPKGPRVPFLLISKVQREDQPFYIMETKVTNEMFAQFAAQNKAKVEGLQWKLGASVNGEDLPVEPGRLNYPVFRVTVDVAHAFAGWLGGELPTPRQWDTAGGRFEGKKGPFREEGLKLDKEGYTWQTGEFALGLKDPKLGRPVPVGAKEGSRDQSVFGCWDMASNGNEWTSYRYRLLDGGEEREDQPVPFDVPPGPKEDISLRSATYRDTQPFLFREPMTPTGFPRKDPGQDISFRVVVPISGK